MAISVDTIHPGLAAELGNVDLTSELHAEDVAVIMSAWADHPVIKIRGPVIDDEQLMAFSRHFGELDHAPVGKLDPGQDPDKITRVTVISNVIENGLRIGGLANKDASWHTDMSYTARPPKASVLHALEVPSSGGNTQFCDMTAAYGRLPDDLLDKILELTIKHDAAHSSVGERRRGYGEITDPRQAPGAVHPIIRRHPDTGRFTLFLGRRYLAYIPGLTLEKSEAVLNRIWSLVAMEEDCWTQNWQVGDTILWDNRVVMHRRDGFDNQARRLMHRTQIKGSESRPSI